MEVSYTGDHQHANLQTYAVAAGWDIGKAGTITAYVGDGTTATALYSDTMGSCAQPPCDADLTKFGLELGNGWAADTIINLIVRNNAYIVGMSGQPGSGGSGGAGGGGGLYGHGSDGAAGGAGSAGSGGAADDDHRDGHKGGHAMNMNYTAGEVYITVDSGGYIVGGGGGSGGGLGGTGGSRGNGGSA